MSRPDKRVCQMRHFKNRVWQRYGLRISTDTYQAMVRAIKNGTAEWVIIHGKALKVRATFIERSTNRVTLWSLRFGGIDGEIRAVYDKHRATLVTAHPALATPTEEAA